MPVRDSRSEGLPELNEEAFKRSRRPLSVTLAGRYRNPAFTVHSNKRRLPERSVKARKRNLVRTAHKPVRGIYVSGLIAGSERRMNQIIRLLDQTELNAVVIDVKNDFGRMSYRSSLKSVRAMGADLNPPVHDIRELLRTLKRRDVYVIGRIVTFNDPLVAKRRPDMALHNKQGRVWRDRNGRAWLNPFDTSARAYNIDIATEAARLGFDEIQFDYVRFPENGALVDREVHYTGREGRSKAAVIGQFLREARRRVHDEGALVSADVFGLVTSSAGDMGIGQNWRVIAEAVDVISPMTYPSHYSSGMYGVKYPDLDPYRIVRRAMADAKGRNDAVRKRTGQAAEIRPWLQSFTAAWLNHHQRYGPKQIEQQIAAARERGIDQYLLWSPNCSYPYVR
jgi:hypothetical protein